MRVESIAGEGEREGMVDLCCCLIVISLDCVMCCRCMLLGSLCAAERCVAFSFVKSYSRGHERASILSGALDDVEMYAVQYCSTQKPVTATTVTAQTGRNSCQVI
jgi:hypothetical protein